MSAPPCELIEDAQAKPEPSEEGPVEVDDSSCSSSSESSGGRSDSSGGAPVAPCKCFRKFKPAPDARPDADEWVIHRKSRSLRLIRGRRSVPVERQVLQCERMRPRTVRPKVTWTIPSIRHAGAMCEVPRYAPAVLPVLACDSWKRCCCLCQSCFCNGRMQPRALSSTQPAPMGVFWNARKTASNFVEACDACACSGSGNFPCVSERMLGMPVCVDMSCAECCNLTTRRCATCMFVTEQSCKRRA